MTTTTAVSVHDLAALFAPTMTAEALRVSTAAPVRLTVRQVALTLAVSDKTVYRLVTAGVLPASRVGTQWRFDPAVLEGDLSGPPASRRPAEVLAGAPGLSRRQQAKLAAGL